MVCVLKSNTVFNLIATHTPISVQSSNSIGLRLQLVYFYLHLYSWCTFIYFYLHLYSWCTFIYFFTAGVLLSTSLQLVYFYLLLYSWCTFIYIFYSWCTFSYIFTAGVLLSTSLQLVYFYLLAYKSTFYRYPFKLPRQDEMCGNSNEHQQNLFYRKKIRKKN